MTRKMNEVVAWAKAHPRPSTPGGGVAGGTGTQDSWDQMCGSLMVRAGDLNTFRASAFLAAMDSGVLNRDYAAAKPGSFHYFDIAGPTNGHVGLDVNGGGHDLLMATRHLRVQWGIALGLQSVGGYVAETKARYLGHADNYCGSKLADFGTAWTGDDPAPVTPPRGAPAPAKAPVNQQTVASTWAWVPPGAPLRKRVQKALAKRKRYPGLVDGKWGVLTIKGVQLTIKGVGYTGLVDGKPGPQTCYFVQVYARRFGDYTGPIDKKLGPRTWANFALGLETP